MSGKSSLDHQRNTTTHTSLSNPPGMDSTPQYRHSFFRSIDATGNDWDQLAVQSGDVFLQRAYLHTLENTPPSDMRFGYLIFYANDRPAGIAICQTKRFSAAESLSDLSTTEKDPCFFNGLANWLKRRVAGWVDAEILVCGNLMVTGEHGFWFDRDLVCEKDTAPLLYTALQDTSAQMDKNGSRIAMLLVKDIRPEQQATMGQYLVKKQFTEFDIQPNMVLHLDEFADFDQYLGAMTTKYRTRAKRAFKKGELLEKKELLVNEVLAAAPHMYELYKSVAKSAGFNVVDLNADYTPAVQKGLDGGFRVFGYYLKDQMVAYCTTLKNGDELEAHFLGYDKSLNHEYQLYLNMLYDMIGVAFDSGCKSVVFARTALEIKSSVGAVPEHLFCYLKHQNPLINNFTSNVLDYLKPVEEWQQRHPFKHLQPDHGGEAE